MLIYPISGIIHKGCNTQRVNQSTETSKLNSLKVIMKTFSEFQMSKSNLLTNHNSKDEDAEAEYVTLIKHILRTVDPNVLSTFYNASKKDFPILKPLLKYSHHSDIMIKNAARISLMIIFQKCQGEAMEHVIEVAAPKHISDIILHLKQAALDVQNFYEGFNVSSTEKVYLCYQEELEYVDDILRLGYNIKKQMTSRLLNDFILPYILTSVIHEKQHIAPLSLKIGLCLLSKLLQTIMDYDMKEIILRIIFQRNEIEENMIIKPKQVLNSLQHILLQDKISTDILYTLHILHILQNHILESGVKNLEMFYDHILYTLIKLLKVNYHFNPQIECLKLKLLLSILQPAMQITISDARWLKLQTFFAQFLEVLYNHICKEICHKITNAVEVIDEEYETFRNMSLDISRIFNDVNYLFEDHKNANKKINYSKIAVYHLFCIRYLYLALKNQEEKLLPIMKMKEKIGQVAQIDDCIPCKKLVCDNFYEGKHFLKMTDRQLLIFQNIEDTSKGIVIFNSYYKDIIWSADTNKTLTICETHNCTSHSKNISKLYTMHLKFKNSEDLQFITHVLIKARSNQIKITRKKLKELLEGKIY